MKEKTIVLGSGISALAYLFYHSDAFALAGDQVGGLFASAKNLGPQYVWKTPSTTRFLTDMGYIDPSGKAPSAATRVIRTGYWWRGKINRVEDLNDSDLLEIRRLYSLKTRGTEPRDSHMSDGKSSFEIYDVPVDELVADLLKRVEMRLVYVRATSVDMVNRSVYAHGHETEYHYDKLVSTVPAPILLKLVSNEALAEKLKAFHKVYERGEETTEVEEQLSIHNRGFADEMIEYVYVPDSHYDFHRVRCVGENEFVREYTLKNDAHVANFPKTALIQKRGQIIGGHEILKQLPSSIKPLGRYAEWRHGIRLEDVLEAIQ